MRLNHALAALLVSLSCAERIAAPHRHHIRQDSNGNVATASGPALASSGQNDAQQPAVTRSADQLPTNTQSASLTSDGGSPQSTASNNGTAQSSSNSTTTASPSATLTSSAIPTAANSTTEDILPIQPQITPGLGVAGAILIVAGLALGFVGIKHRATQTFLSTALVTALGVSVLIVYLMNPPVSNAIQGAFVIGAVLGGCLLGGLALIFKEVSEGLGCILGGFCLAMWLLILVPGGTITNQVGRIILICMLCASCFCLYISRFTRIYGIIICTAFAGATAFILGVDCFSKAGMKEFWLYIWNVNDNIFPLSTDTYPITKNLRAETAGIVILAFFGTMSQIKIWKIVKESRAKRDAERMAYEEAREAEEAELGRGIEEQVKRDRAEWESNYGHKDMTKAQAYSVTTRSIDGFDGGVSEVDLIADTSYGEKKRSSFPMTNLSPDESRQEDRRASSRTSLSAYSAEKGASVPPSVLEAETDVRDDDRGDEDGASQLEDPTREVLANSPDASLEVSEPIAEDSPNRKSMIAKLSTESLAAKDALEAVDEEQSPIEEDLASSVAATAAEPPDADALSLAMSRPASMLIEYGRSTTPVQDAEQLIEDEDEEALHLGAKHLQSGADARQSSTISPASYYDAEAVRPDSEHHTDLKTKLPTRMSKAAMSYRTNEWAKGISHAEPEPIEEVPDHTLDAVQIEIGNAVEAARAEENNAAPAPPPAPPAPPTARRVSADMPAPAVAETRRASTNPYRQSKRISSNPVPAPSGEENEVGWSRPLAKRSSSNPLSRATPVYSTDGGAIVHSNSAKSPTKSARRESSRQSNVVSPTPSMSNLLDERRERMDQRLTTTSFMIPTISENPEAVGPGNSRRGSEQVDKISLLSATKPATNTSIEEETHVQDDEESMTLAQRKALVQQQQQQMYQQQNHSQLYQQPYSQHKSQTFTTLQHRPSQTFNTLQHRPSQTFQPPPGNAHHPPRRISTHNSNKAAANWSQWRASTQLTSNLSSSNLLAGVQQSDQQIEMLRQQREQVEYEKKVRRREQEEQQAEKDRVMRMGGLHDKHRAALARMQSKVDLK